MAAGVGTMALAQGGATVLGALARGLMAGGPSQIHEEAIRAAMAGDATRTPLGDEARAASSRIAGLRNPYIGEALLKQDETRLQQDRYLEGLRELAMGHRSDVAAQADEERKYLEQAIAGQAASARGAYNPALEAQARRQASMVGQGMAARVAAERAREQQGSAQLWSQALGAQRSQEQQSMDAVRRQQKLERDQFATSQRLAANMFGIASGEKIGRIKSELDIQKMNPGA